jgi:hypothetical protein
MEPRLKSEFWVKAHVRRCMSAGITATVARLGSPEAGDILIKLNRLDGTFEVFSRATKGDGTRVWLRATGQTPVDEATADAYIQRQLKLDPDLWLIEIEDKSGRHLLDDKVE